MSAYGACSFCGKSSRLKCTGCLGTYYCSKYHQKQDWKNHKDRCIAYKIEHTEGLGRHLVASRCICEGEIIIKEKALIDGPPQATPPICLVCYDLLNESSKIDCSRCGWPMCSESCENLHCQQPECRITARRENGKVKITSFVQGLPHPSYQCITVLRCLNLKEDKPTIWNKLMKLESHCEERKHTPKYNSDQVFVAKFISEFLNFTSFPNHEILKVTGIVEINAHEVPLKKPGYIALYEKASLLEHSCRANCMKSFTNCGQLVIRAAETIYPGDHLSICYTDPLWGKKARLKHLLETKYFSCQCCRCLDPTELGTHFNSVKCSNAQCNGFLVPLKDKSTSEDGFEFKNRHVKTKCKSKSWTWKCQSCKNNSTKESRMIEKISENVFKLDKKSATCCMDFLNKYDKILTENHYLMIYIKLALIDILAWPNKLSSLDGKTLEWIIEICEKIANVLKILIPAENRILGVLYFQLHFALIEMFRRESETVDGRQTLMKCQTALKKAYKYLVNEPDVLPEGMMALEAKKALESISGLKHGGKNI